MQTIGVMLDRTKGFGKGFNFARIALAFAVLFWHDKLLVSGSRDFFDERILWALNYPIMPMFFGLSGFLVAASAQRLNMKDFFLNRVARIFPALAMETFLSALVLGPLVTTLPLAGYFDDQLFWRYLRNFVGDVQYYLPGVFSNMPHPGIVNGSLWTVPAELFCYIFMAILMLIGTQKRPLVLCLVALALVEARPFILECMQTYMPNWRDTYPHLNAFTSRRGTMLVPTFLLGVACYNARYSIPYDRRIFIACAAIILVLSCLSDVRIWTSPVFMPIFCLLSAYMVIFIGLTDFDRFTPAWMGDYSYGVYLYGFPIQQASLHFFPGTPANLWLLHFAAILPVVLVFAAFSWICVERPILNWRKSFLQAAKARKAAAREFNLSQSNGK